MNNPSCPKTKTFYISSLGQLTQSKHDNTFIKFTQNVQDNFYKYHNEYFKVIGDFLATKLPDNIFTYSTSFIEVLSNNFIAEKITLSVGNFVASSYVLAVYAYDNLFIGNIDSYKKGILRDDEFLNKISYPYFGSKDQIKQAWNKMSDLTPEIKQNLSNITHWLNVSDNKLILISTSNKLHYENILEQSPELYQAGLNGEIDQVISFKHNELDKSKLIELYLKSNHIDQPENQFVTLFFPTKAFCDIFQKSSCSFMFYSDFIEKFIPNQIELFADYNGDL